MQQTINESLIHALQAIADLPKGTECETFWMTPVQAQHLLKLCKSVDEPSRRRVVYDNLSTRQKEALLKQAAEHIAKTSHGTDPHSIPQHVPGAKLDAEKPRMGLMVMGFKKALAEVGKVSTYGAVKYTDNGWCEVPNGEARYLDAAFRHLLDDTLRDTESGYLHLAHAAWNILAVLELKLRKQHVSDNQ